MKNLILFPVFYFFDGILNELCSPSNDIDIQFGTMVALLNQFVFSEQNFPKMK